MKKLAILALIGLTTISVARADYKCTGEEGETMAVNYSNDGLKTKVSVNHVFSGLSEIYSGTYDQHNDQHKLLDSAGNIVELKIVEPVDHGGRCGRCTPSFPSLTSFAKLTVNQEVKEFVCLPARLK